MRIFIWLFISSIFLGIAYNQCLDDQQALLLAFKNDLIYDHSSIKIAGWNLSVNCCHWGGITCDTDGRVIGLDLNNQSIKGAINNSSSLFRLEFLQSLNLAYNTFQRGLLPSGFGNLTRLTYLNLSNTYFKGQVPIEFSLMTKLVTLDLSSAFAYALTLENPDLRMLIQNLTELRHLHLDKTNILTHDWSGVISSFLPNLQVLSLRQCNLSGPLDSSLAKLHHLSVIFLDGNNFSSEIPESFADLRNLTVLSLQGCDLIGLLPYKIFQVRTLKTINLSRNARLKGLLPDSMGALGLENLDLSYTRVGGRLPDSIGSLKMLSRVILRACEFNGPIPDSMQNLTVVEYLDLSFNHFTSSIPSFQSSKNHLVFVNFHGNNLTGEIPSSHWEGCDKLEYLNLASNSFSGSFPESFLTLKALGTLYLFNNSISGTISESINVSFNQLEVLDLSSNKFEGPIPGFIFKLAALLRLDLSANKFTLFGRSASVNLSSLMILDLSDNQLSGEIPNWIWEVRNGSLQDLNLSHNKFSSLQKPYTFPFLLNTLDLHSNNLEGDILIPPKQIYYLDYSSNNFRSLIPVDFGNVLTSTSFFSISNNKLVGPIPQSICNASRLTVLDLSNNSLNGTLPSCLVAETLRVLNLRGNNLTGNVLDVFPERCLLQTLDLGSNHLKGPLPISLVKCKRLMVLDLGHNMITGSFPCWLNNLSNLHVFVIRSNRFHGNITCLGPNSLQIIDIASNRFSGVLPPTLFTRFQGIINNTRSELDHLYYRYPSIVHIYYQDSVSVVIKGTRRELVKILNIFTAIDFSNNSFQGSIPITVGDLKLLKLVNLSHNALTGPIPVSVRKLRNLESMDLSVNKLSGSIPQQLASLSFLSSLNLSYNELSGRIPRGTQFQTFTNSSFIGNQGLCGLPLNKSCNIDATSSPETNEDVYYGTDLYVSIGLGFVVGYVMIVGSLVFLRRWRTWCCNYVDGLVSRIRSM